MATGTAGLYPTDGIHGIEITCSVREDGHASVWSFSADNTAFALTVSNGVATFRFKYPFLTFAYAEQAVNEFLRSWEADTLLQTGAKRRVFTVRGSSAPGHGSRAYAYFTSKVTGPQAEANTRLQRPWCRHRYWHQPLIAGLIERYESYRSGREPIAVVGYLCVSALQQAFGGSKGVEEALCIDHNVWRELSRLVSVVGSVKTARKIAKDHLQRELTTSETYWIESVLLRVLQRAGEVFNQRHPGDRLSLAELPPL